MGTQNVNITIGGPKNPSNYTYKTVVLKSNLSFASQIGEENTKYVIKWNFDLGGQTVNIPTGCILNFDGGVLSNGTLVGNDTYLAGDKGTGDNILASVTLEGTWKHNAVVGVDGSLSDSSTNPVENKVVKQALDGKVDKVEGKGLSSNDYTDGEKAKLGNYPEYSSVSGAINGKVDKVEGKDLSDNNYDDTSKNKVDNLAAVATSGSYNDLTDKPEIPGGQVQADWAENDESDPSFIQHKPDVVDPSSLARVATTGSYDDLFEKPTIPTVPTNVSAFENDADYVTENDLINLSEIDDTVSEVVYNPQSRAIEKTINGKMTPVLTINELKDLLGIETTVNQMLASHSSEVQTVFDAYNQTIADLTERIATLEKKPSPTPTPEEWPTIVSADEFEALVTAFNATPPINGAIGTSGSPNTLRTYLKKYYDEAYAEFTADSSILFSESTYPEIEDYRTIEGVKGTNMGEDKAYYTQAFRAMGAWLMAMCLTELYPSSSPNSTTDNNQTILFRTAYNYGAPDNQGIKVKLYDNYHIHCDPMVARLAAGAIYAKIRGGAFNVNGLNVTDSEVDGLATNTISGDAWSNLGFSHTRWYYKQDGTTTTNASAAGVIGRCGETINALGYTVNTNSFLPAAPGPRVEHSFAAGGIIVDGTTIVNPLPSVQCDDAASFNNTTQNYLVDEAINEKVIEKYNMGSETPRSVWDSYTTAKQQRLVQVGCTPTNSKMHMFGAQKPVVLVSIDNKSCINVTMPDGTVKSLVDFGWNSNYFKEYEFALAQTSNLSIKGPFYMHSNLWSYINSDNLTTIGNLRNQVAHEKYIRNILEIADNMRYPTYDVQYGRRRPGAASNLVGYPGISTTPGDLPNEIYSKSLALLVPDDGYDVNNWGADYNSGIASDGPTSYPSGHSSQIWTMAMALIQANPSRMEEYMQNAYDYSVNRSIGRYHWNSDIIYGRLFGTIALPIINAMTSLRSGYTAFKNKVLNSAPTPGEKGRAYQDTTYNGGSSSSSTFTVRVVNKTGATVKFTNIIALRLQWTLANDGYTDMGPTVVDYRVNRGTAYQFTTLENNGVVEFSDLPILSGWVSRYVNRRFATQAELTNYSSGLSQSPNVSVADENGYSTTDAYPGVTPRAFSSTGDAIFKGGATYTIYLGGSEGSAYAAGSGGSTNVVLRIENKTNSSFVFGNKAAFVLNIANSNPDSHNNVRAKNLPLINVHTVGNVNTIAAGGAEEFEFAIESPNTSFENYYFATKDVNNYELDSNGNPKYFYASDSGDYFYSNLLIYDENGSAHTYPMPVMPNSVQFNKGKKYVIEYMGDSYVEPQEHTTPTVTGGTLDTTGITDVVATVTIKNESGNSLTIDPRVTFFTYGTYDGYTGYFRIKGYLSGNNNLTLLNGESQTYTVTFPKNNEQTPTVAVGMNFDPISQYNHYGTNNAFYIGGVSYKCINFSSNYQFKIGATYLMVIDRIEQTA